MAKHILRALEETPAVTHENGAMEHRAENTLDCFPAVWGALPGGGF